MRRYYQILGVSPKATSEEIKAAWLFSIKAFHPDKFSRSSPEQQRTAEARTKAINEAYAILSDPHKRAAYDRESVAQGPNVAASPPPPPPTRPPPPPTSRPPPTPPPQPTSTPPPHASAPVSGIASAGSAKGFNAGGLLIVGVVLVIITTAAILTAFQTTNRQTLLRYSSPSPAATIEKEFDADKFLNAPKAEAVVNSKQVPTNQESVSRTPSPPPTPVVTYRVSGLPKRDRFLNVRAGPGTNHPVVAALMPTGRGIILGPGRVNNGGTIWQEIFSGTYHGWVNAEYLVTELPVAKP